MSSGRPVDQVLDHVVQLERELLRPDVRRQPARVLVLLHPEFREFGASGTVWDAQAISELLATQTDAAQRPVEMEEPMALALGSASIPLTYVARGDDRSLLRSSIWFRHGDGWRLVFRRGTPAASGA